MDYFWFQISRNSSPTVESPIEPLAELLGENGDINATDSCGRTILHNLAADGNATLLELAIETCPTVILMQIIPRKYNVSRNVCSFDVVYYRLSWKRLIATGRQL